MIRFFAALLISGFLTTQAFAAGACYTPEEMHAEQLLRLHSELMVITVTCQTGSEGENLVPAYTTFTHNNIGVLHDAEQTMIGYYEAHYNGKGIEKLDQLRTRLANEYGQKSANITAPLFCRKYRDKVLAFYRANMRQIEDEVALKTGIERSYASVCGSTTRLAKKD